MQINAYSIYTLGAEKEEIIWLGMYGLVGC